MVSVTEHGELSDARRPFSITKPVVTIRNNSAVYLADEDLIVPVQIDTLYSFRMQIFFYADGAADFKIRIMTPTDVEIQAQLFELGQLSVKLTQGSEHILAGLGAGVLNSALIIGMIHTSIGVPVAGDCTLEWRQSTAHASDYAIQAGSAWERSGYLELPTE